MFNVLDLNIWQAIHIWVDVLHKDKRHNPEAIVETVESAWFELHQRKLLTAFEMLNDVAAEALEGKVRGGPRSLKMMTNELLFVFGLRQIETWL